MLALRQRWRVRCRRAEPRSQSSEQDQHQFVNALDPFRARGRGNRRVRERRQQQVEIRLDVGEVASIGRGCVSVQGGMGVREDQMELGSRPVRRGEASADAKSILSILALAAGFGTVVTVVVDGSDEEDVMKELSVLFLSGFGEI